MEVTMPQSAARTKPHDDTGSATKTGQKPVEKFRDGPVQVSIWQNQSSKGAFRAASFEVRYRDSQEQWQTGRSYTSSALLHLESAAREARSRIERWKDAGNHSPSP